MTRPERPRRSAPTQSGSFGNTQSRGPGSWGTSFQVGGVDRLPQRVGEVQDLLGIDVAEPVGDLLGTRDLEALVSGLVGKRSSQTPEGAWFHLIGNCSNN